jgi:predicted TPR repeat methyltransferase
VIDIAKFFDKALESQKNDEPDLAITLYQEILSHDPNHLPTLFNLATLYNERNEFNKAQPYYDKVIELEPDFVRGYYNSAICQLQQKNITQAQSLLEQAITLVPEYGAAQHILGLILFKQSLWSESKQHLMLALAQNKEVGEILNHLGMACLHLGELDDAEFYLNLAIEQMPYLAEAQYHLGVIHLKRGNYEAAEKCFQEAVDRDPEHFGAWYNLGLLKKQQGFLKLADECLSRAQAIQPDSEYVAFLRAAVNHASTPEHPPEGFVQDLFDRYAGYYDAQMSEGIDYQVPQQLYHCFKEHVVTAPRSLTIVDLGCGTGLAGELFRPEAKNLRGIDLSSYMLDAARAKNIYDDLQQAEILEVLLNFAPRSIDVFIAADVLGYIGVLDQLFERVYIALKSEGHFVFSIESGDQSVALSERIRFTHSSEYIHVLCEKFGFEVIDEKEVDLRQGVAGSIFIVKK